MRFQDPPSPEERQSKFASSSPQSQANQSRLYQGIIPETSNRPSSIYSGSSNSLPQYRGRAEVRFQDPPSPQERQSKVVSSSPQSQANQLSLHQGIIPETLNRPSSIHSGSSHADSHVFQHEDLLYDVPVSAASLEYANYAPAEVPLQSNRNHQEISQSMYKQTKAEQYIKTVTSDQRGAAEMYRGIIIV